MTNILEFFLKRNQKDLNLTGLIAKLRMLLKQNDGSAAIEFGILGPIFIAFIIGIIDVGMMLVAQNALDAAASRASQFGLTGQSSTNLSRKAAIEKTVKDTIKAYSGGMIDLDQVKISVSAYDEFTAIGKPEPLINDANGNGTWDLGDSYFDINGNEQWDEDQGITNSFGLAGQAVRYEISYDWQPMYRFFGIKKPIKLTGISPIINEDFPDN